MTRKENITYLENAYNAQSNDVLVVYGMPRVGLSEVIFDFLKDKEYFYYKARPCDINTQLGYIAKQIEDTTKNPGIYVDEFSKMLQNYIISSDEKKIIVFDEFVYLSKDNKTFLNLIISLLRDQIPNNKALIILSTTNVCFVEDEMIDFFGKSVYELKGIFKIEPLSAMEVLRKYKNLSFNDFVSVYSCIGGNKELWNYYEENSNYKDFIINVLISKGGIYSLINGNLLPEDLREKSVYNTILYILSDGDVKLNDIHEKSGFDRAKVAVYLKNLSKRGIVCKSESYCFGDGKDVKKGIYNICDPFIRFWYKYIFPNLSMFEILSAERFYRRFIEPSFNAFREKNYVVIAEQYLNYRAKKDGLGIDADSFGIYLDKEEAIDIAGCTKSGKKVLCACRFIQPHMAYARLEDIIASAKKAGIDYDYILLVSSIDFDQKLHLYSSVHDNVKLIDFK